MDGVHVYDVDLADSGLANHVCQIGGLYFV